MQTLLGSALMASKGFAAPEVEAAFTRARELCQHLGDSPQLFPVLPGLGDLLLCPGGIQDFSGNRGKLLTSHAQQHQDPFLLLGAHFELGANLFVQGQFTQALEQLEQQALPSMTLRVRPRSS